MSIDFGFDLVEYARAGQLRPLFDAGDRVKRKACGTVMRVYSVTGDEALLVRPDPKCLNTYLTMTVGIDEIEHALEVAP